MNGHAFKLVKMCLYCLFVVFKVIKWCFILEQKILLVTTSKSCNFHQFEPTQLMAGMRCVWVGLNPIKCVPLDISWELHIEYCRVVLMRWWRHKRRKYVSLEWIKSWNCRMIVFMIVLISCSVHDNEDGKTNENFGVIKKISLILEYGRDSVERPMWKDNACQNCLTCIFTWLYERWVDILSIIFCLSDQSAWEGQ